MTPEVFYIAVDPKGAFHQNRWSKFHPGGPPFYTGSSYDDPRPGGEIKNTSLRLFANARTRRSDMYLETSWFLRDGV